MDLLDGVLLLLALVIVYHAFRLGYAFVCFVFSLRLWVGTPSSEGGGRRPLTDTFLSA